MTPLLCIDPTAKTVRRYVRRDCGLGVHRLEITDECEIVHQDGTLALQLEAFRVKPKDDTVFHTPTAA